MRGTDLLYLQRVQLQMWQAMSAESFATMSMEVLQSRLRKLKKMNIPIPKDIIERVRQMKSSGMNMPEDLARLFDGEKVPRAGSVGWSVDRAYARDVKRNDERRSVVELREAALSLDSPARIPFFDFLPAHVDPKEADWDFGKTLGDLFVQRFQKSAFGAEFLGRFRGADGKLAMPDFIVEKHSQQPNRSKDRAVAWPDNLLSINHWDVMKLTLDSLPPAQRAMRTKELADPARLRKFLESHPDFLGKVLDRFEGAVVHELSHTLQHRRLQMDAESARGNIPSGDPLEWEIEAFRNQYLYELSRSAESPERIERLDDRERSLAITLLSDYRDFRGQIINGYLENVTHSQSAQEIRDVQEARKAIAARIMAGGGANAEVQSLKLKGYAHGDRALTDAEVDATQREKFFLRDELPDLKEQLKESNIVRRVRPQWGVRLALALGYSDKDIAALQDAYLKQPLDKSTLSDRLAANFDLLAYYKARKRKTVPAVIAAYQRDMGAYVNEALDSAAKPENSGQRETYLHYAKRAAAMLPPAHAAARRYQSEADKIRNLPREASDGH